MTRWSAKASPARFLDHDAIPADSGTLGRLAKGSQPLLLSGANLVREDYAHLHARRSLFPGLCSHDHQPDPEGRGSSHFDDVFTPLDFSGLVELVEYAAPAFSSAVHYKGERNSHLASISRLYPALRRGKSFQLHAGNGRTQSHHHGQGARTPRGQAVNLWLVKDEQDVRPITGRARSPPAKWGLRKGLARVT